MTLENLEIKHGNFNNISTSLQQEYQSLIVPEHHLAQLSDLNEVTFLAAHLQGKPVGLILAKIQRGFLSGELLSFFVQEKYRNKKIGTSLLKELNGLLDQFNNSLLVFNYSSENPCKNILESMFLKVGWSGPKVYLKNFYFDGFTFNPPWLSKTLNFPQGFQEFFWSEITKEEKKIIDHQVEQGRIPLTVYPFNEFKNIEPLNSLGIRYGGKVVGWMITHRVATDTIRFSALYIHKEYLFKQAWIKLLVDAINLQRRSTVQWALFEVLPSQADFAWQSFVDRRLKPYANRISYTLQMWKNVVK